MNGNYSSQMHEQGLSGRRLAALRYLLEAGPLTIGQLRDYLYINDSSTSELVARLEQDGYVSRTRSEADNRVVMVALTPAGREATEQAPLGGIPLLREKLAALPAKRLALIHDALVELAQLVEIANGS
jgi:DNA-binding MarR family transcriptional regulator